MPQGGKRVPAGRRKRVIPDEDYDASSSSDSSSGEEAFDLSQIKEDHGFSPSPRKRPPVRSTRSRVCIRGSSDAYYDEPRAKKRKTLTSRSRRTSEEDFFVEDGEEEDEVGAEEERGKEEAEEEIGVMPMLSSDEEMQFESAYHRDLKNRPPEVAFNAYLIHVAGFILYPNYEDLLSREKRIDWRAVRRNVEEKLTVRKEVLLQSSAWQDSFTKYMQVVPFMQSTKTESYRDCEACGRSSLQVLATSHLQGCLMMSITFGPTGSCDILHCNYMGMQALAVEVEVIMRKMEKERERRHG
eukprot:TRINITY_DN1678_c0_g1_i2.p1 TRINITY_DN1678_c0_g1~~TRINITY_DN1678_c0_g1_i2.p1  ORF type:complete len:298 (-),score=91.32 TRINITY_DN1678_c0_g1_i2:1156-2049(-)